MRRLPETLLNSLEGIIGFDREAFEKVHYEKQQLTSVRINPAKFKLDVSTIGNDVAIASPEIFDLELSLSSCEKVGWSQYGFYLPKRPSFTFDPLFHAGCYYVQEASSMFLEQALSQLADLSQPLKILDVSAAPGGKSTHIQSLISKDSLLVCNDVIRSRCHILVDNIVKWGCNNVVVTNNDPKSFAKLKGYFDVIVVDAPCSGSGLFRKDEEAIDEWSLNNVELCSQRQQRILADVLPSLKEGGLLIYSTCSYSPEEDEQITNWLVDECEMKNENVALKSEWGIVESEAGKTDSVGYRFFPDKVKGEGFYLACFRKSLPTEESRSKFSKKLPVPTAEQKILDSWLKTDGLSFVKHSEKILALTETVATNLQLLQGALNIQYAGIAVGEIKQGNLVPNHALAATTILKDGVEKLDLPYDDAIKYLQRNDLSVKPTTAGWQLVSYKNHNLGWIKALPGRINNYFPKELRILKQFNDNKL